MEGEMIMEKKVRDFMLHEGFVKLGSKDGAGFIFCGKLEDLVPLDGNFRKAQLSKFRSALATAEERLAHFEEDWDNYREGRIFAFRNARKTCLEESGPDFEPKAFPKDKYPDEEAFAKHVDEVEKPGKLKTRQTRVNKYRNAIENYTDILDRPVVDAYESLIANEDGSHDLIIIFEGVESGPWWSRDEYECGWYYGDEGKLQFRPRFGEGAI
jgi:hypothetical protein